MNANAPLHSDIDNTIDRALSALRAAQPRSGSEMLAGRILAHLEHRTTAHHITEPGGLPFHSFIVKGWGIVCGSKRGNARPAIHLAVWSATAAAILAIASLLILHRPGAPSSTRIARQGGVGVPAQIPSPGLAAGFSPLNHSAQKTRALAPARSPVNAVILTRSRKTPVFRNCSDHLRIGCPIHDDAVVMGGVATTPTDAQLLADLHAPSHPAPPLPPTPQEKLFLRMLRYGNLIQIAELNPEVRARQSADETAAFKAFFPDPPPVQQPNGDTE